MSQHDEELKWLRTSLAAATAEIEKLQGKLNAVKRLSGSENVTLMAAGQGTLGLATVIESIAEVVR